MNPSYLSPLANHLWQSSLFAAIAGMLNLLTYVRADFRAHGGITNLQLEGGPAWIDSERYQITAKAQGPAGIRAMEGSMLQDLLENRFHLKTHRELRQAEVYALTIAKGGLKIKPAEPGGCTPKDPDEEPYQSPAPGQTPYCGDLMVGMGAHRINYDVASGTMTQLAQNLGARLARLSQLKGSGRDKLF